MTRTFFMLADLLLHGSGGVNTGYQPSVWYLTKKEPVPDGTGRRPGAAMAAPQPAMAINTRKRPLNRLPGLTPAAG